MLEKFKSYSDGQEIPCNIWSLKVHYCVHMSLPHIPIISQLNQINPFHTLSHNTSLIFMILLSHLCSGLPSGLFSAVFLRKTMTAFLLCPVCVTCPTHPILYHGVNQDDTNWGVQIIRIPHYAILLSLLLFHLSYAQISSSAQYSWTASAYTPP